MTTVVVYDEFKAVQAVLSGADHETVTIDIEPGATRKIELQAGQVLEVSHEKPEELAPPTFDDGNRIGDPNVPPLQSSPFAPSSAPPLPNTGVIPLEPN